MLPVMDPVVDADVVTDEATDGVLPPQAASNPPPPRAAADSPATRKKLRRDTWPRSAEQISGFVIDHSIRNQVGRGLGR